MIILNLTQHNATQDQIEAGVVEPSAEFKKLIQNKLTFEGLPSKDDIKFVAEELVDYALLALGELDLPKKGTMVMIGGAPYLMSALEKELAYAELKAVYAFSERVSEEVTQDDGSVRKVNVFKHMGFVEA